MKIWHSQVDARNFRRSSQCSLAHIKQGMLHAHAVVPGKFLQQGIDDLRAHLRKVWTGRNKVPRDGRLRAENAIRSWLQRGESILDVAGKRGLRCLQNRKTIQPRS